MKASAVKVCFLLASALLFAVGCGSGSSSSSSTTTAAAVASPSSSVPPVLASARKGTYAPPPTSGPRAQPGKSVWVISCGQALESCSDEAEAAVAAAQAAGWHATLFDTKLQEGLIDSGIRQAIAAHANGIIISGDDCAFETSALQAARAATVPTVGVDAYDCNQSNPGAKPGFTATVKYGKDWLTYPQFLAKVGAVQAAWIANQIHDQGTILDFILSDSYSGLGLEAGFEHEISSCSGCKVVKVKLASADLGNGAQEKAQQVLLHNPTAKAVNVPIDSMMILGIAQALRSSGRASQLAVMGGEGYPPNIQLLHEGIEDASYGYDAKWAGWAAVDELNRVLHHQPTAVEGLGFQLVDKSNAPAHGGFVAPIDYRSAYLKVWTGK